MQWLCFTIQPQSSFGTALVGDTLFGQFCWAICYLFGEEKLKNLIDKDKNYQNNPFVIFADAVPKEFIYKPVVPEEYLGVTEVTAQKRRELKQQTYIAIDMVSQPLKQWKNHLKTNKEVLKTLASNPTLKNKITQRYPQAHNSIDRRSQTTGEGDFAPYTEILTWYYPNIQLDIYCLLDTDQLSIENCQKTLEYIGKTGYGKDGNLGKGKFNIIEVKNNISFTTPEKANAYLTLAPCAPQGQDFEVGFYHTLTRFGKHGDVRAIENFRKNPLLLANTAAIFKPKAFKSKQYIGQGLQGNISLHYPETIHQAYTPVIAVYLEEENICF